MFIQVYRKGTKRKVKLFNAVRRVVIKCDNLMIYPLIEKAETFDLSLFDFCILN